jgi:putative ABC transport system permease protein
MTVALRARPAATTSGAPARRAIARWAWRLFRREWRRQSLILLLLIVAIAATTIGLGVASNASVVKADPAFGTANTIISLPGSDPKLAVDLAALRSHFGTIDVVAHQSVTIAGSVSTLDVRDENPTGSYSKVTLRLDAGRYPTGSGEVAVTRSVATDFGLRLGGVWPLEGRTLRIVGVVENPLDLLDRFALVPPGQVLAPNAVSVLVDANRAALQSLRLPSGVGLSIDGRGSGNKTVPDILVLVLATLAMLFVGLIGVAGFTVIAQRRLQALGMLGAMGATDRHIRLVMLADGAVVGATAAIVGTAVGFAGWLAFVPALQSAANHRVDPFAMPWWAIGAATALTFATAIASAWWPARAAARISVVAALSGRPPRPQPAHRLAAVGAVAVATGTLLLAFADQRRVGFVVGGTVATAVGVLFLAPLAIAAVGAVCGRWTISVRLAVRDLARYQARSAAALGAITLAIGIAATIAISASAAQTPQGPGNLAANQLMLYLTPAGAGNQVPPVTAAQLQLISNRVSQLASSLGGGTVLALEQAYNPQSGLQPPQPGPGGVQPAGFQTPTMAQITGTPGGGEQISALVTLYVATPAVLAHYGIKANQVDPASDVISGRQDLAGEQIFAPETGSGPPSAAPSSSATRGLDGIAHPTIQVMKQLPNYSSDPGTLITSHAMRTLNLQPLPAGWLIQTAKPLTSPQMAAARNVAANAGVYVETRTAQKSLAPLRNWSTTAGVLLALGVLGMTVGLIRSEAANDLRTLTAAGASGGTRRTLTAATAATLAVLGALLGVAGAYVALVAWHRSNLRPLEHVPFLNLAVILAGLPAIAMAAGWLLAGREPPALGRRALD